MSKYQFLNTVKIVNILKYKNVNYKEIFNIFFYNSIHFVKYMFSDILLSV